MQEEAIQAERWEGVYPVPDLRLPCCPWCRKESDRYFIVVFESARGTAGVQCEPVCERCSVPALHFIAMRKQGLSRKEALRDFGFRE
jgi:hypothetical protein